MPKKKHVEKYATKANHQIFHPYSLQQLDGSRFIRVTNQILAGRLALLSFRTPRLAQTP